MENKRFSIKVKEWFHHNVCEAAAAYHVHIVRTYAEINGIEMSDGTTLRIEEVLVETEQAIKVAIDAETGAGNYRAWTTWIPKCVIVEGI